MTSYLQTQVAVYQHLLARHEADPTFTFSLRQSFQKEPTTAQGLFIGTEKSRYFAFTLWNIPISFPGSAMDLFDYLIEVNRDGSYKLSLYFFTTKTPVEDYPKVNEQNMWSLEFAETLKEQQWPKTVRWVEDKPDIRIRSSNDDYPERYCHKTGQLSNGKTSKRNPVLVTATA